MNFVWAIADWLVNRLLCALLGRPDFDLTGYQRTRRMG